jgi:methionyl-tRNA synthetase
MTLSHLYQLDDNTDRILVTCALPYVNAVPHLGNLVPIVSADTYARWLHLKGYRSVYICATDEHGTRTEIEAAKAGLDEETYCRRLHQQIWDIFRWFNVEFTHFGRTSRPDNHRLTQDIFLKADANGYIEEQEIRQLYCESCEMFLPDTYVEGTCPYCNTPGAKGDQCDACGRFLDPLELVAPRCKTCGEPPTVRETRHLFLRLDALAPRLEQWIRAQEHWEGVIRNMPLGWIAEGMRPRAITRDLEWGVKVPKAGYEHKVFYVWFDAPIGYIAATAEWAREAGESLEAWWKHGRARLIHFLGKDNVPFHTLIWPGTLMAADDGWNLPDYIASNEYLTYEGGAFSKSRQRGIFSDDAASTGFPADGFRFFLIANRPEKRDSAFTWEAFQALVNADLVGNFGNLANRLLSFVAKRFKAIPEPAELSAQDREVLEAAERKRDEIDAAYSEIELRAATRLILELSDIGNGYLQAAEPWKTFKTDKDACRTTLWVACRIVDSLARACWPIMPERCQAVLAMMGTDIDGQLEAGTPIERPERLFEPVEDELVAQFTERFRGSGSEKIEPLEFVKRPEITWPCVILELVDLNVRRRVKALERWKEARLETADLDAIEQGERLKAYYEGLETRDRGRKVSVQNLLDLVRREGKLPNINSVVDIYNTYSLTESIVMGAYERRTIHGRLIYAEADGNEHFIPVSGAEREPVQPGEWVLKDETDMVVTKVTSKQSEAAAVTTATTACAMCIQGNDVIDTDALVSVAREMADLIVEYCGGSYRIVHAG